MIIIANLGQGLLKNLGITTQSHQMKNPSHQMKYVTRYFMVAVDIRLNHFSNNVATIMMTADSKVDLTENCKIITNSQSIEIVTRFFFS